MEIQRRIEKYLPLNELERILKYLYIRQMTPEEIDFDSAEFKQQVIPEKHMNREETRQKYMQFLSSVGDSSYLSTDFFIPKGRNLYIRKFPRYLRETMHHHRDALEINIILQGTFSQRIGNHFLEMHSGDIFFVAPNVLHGTRAYDDQTIVLSVIVYQDVIKDILRNIGTEKNGILLFLTRILYGADIYPYLICHTGFDDDLAGMMIDLEQNQDYQTIYTDKYMETVLELFLLRLLMNYKERIILGESIPKQESNLINIMEYIRANYRTVTLDSLARTYNYSPAYLSTLIKKKYGRNFREIVRMIRLESAIRLLTETDYSMTRIAELTGFFDKSYFQNSFRSAYGITPAKYRENIIHK